MTHPVEHVTCASPGLCAHRVGRSPQALLSLSPPSYLPSAAATTSKTVMLALCARALAAPGSARHVRHASHSLCLALRPFPMRPSHVLRFESRSLSSKPVKSSSSSTPSSSPASNSARTSSPSQKSIWSRFLPTNPEGSTTSNTSSFRKIVSLAMPEKKPLGAAIGLLMMSSAVSMSVPFTIGKLIDFFTSTNPVSVTHYNPITKRMLRSAMVCSKYRLDCPLDRLQRYSCSCSRRVRRRMQDARCSCVSLVCSPRFASVIGSDVSLTQASGSSHAYENAHTRQHYGKRWNLWRRARVTS